jgi:hypothetical protein
MTLHVVLAVGALVAAVLLLVFSASRTLAGIAVVSAALEVAMAFGLIRVHVAGVPLGLVFGLGLAVPGALAWLRAAAKPAASASAIVAFVGIVQVLMYLTSRPA